MGSFYPLFKSYDIPFVPSSWERLKVMIELAEVKPGQKAADLGSGDGRVVIALAKQGAIAHGFEIDEERVKLSRQKIAQLNLQGQAFIHHQSFWDADLTDFEIITLYGITSIMEKLEKKLKHELPQGAKVISNFFTFPNWKPLTKKGEVYLYIKE